MGTIVESDPGYDEDTRITCRGFPTCSGSYTSHIRPPTCNNYLGSAGSATITGLDLATHGEQHGTITLTRPVIDRLPDGTCLPGSQVVTETMPYGGTWDLDTRTGRLRISMAQGAISDLRFIADVTAEAPLFPMTVSARIGSDSSTASAHIRFRQDDIGREGGVFLFALAPATRVQGGLEAKAVRIGHAGAGPKAEPVPCVLAQVSPAGELAAVSVADLQPLATGPFGAFGQAVPILNDAPTSSVAGATFYVGYGASSTAMASEGNFRQAALVPGESACPMVPFLTALWSNPQEPGWGLNIAHQGSLAFATLFTYDEMRAPMWLVMPSGVLQPDGRTFEGDLYRTTGPAFNASPFPPIAASNVARVGRMSITLWEENAAVLTYDVDNVDVRKPVRRLMFGSRAAVCLPTVDSRASSTNYQDLWWNAAESGWGLNVAHQDDILFATLFSYDNLGRGFWLVMPSGAKQPDGSYLGELLITSGAPFNAGPPMIPTSLAVAGIMELRFADGDNGTLTYTYSGATVTKQITRQVFSTPQSFCN
jgi:hypothetical protein